MGSWCLLIAVTERLEVIAWQWCGGESTPAWKALFGRIPAPTVIVCDGGTGVASAIRATWPETKTQRCVFHVQMNIRKHLTLKPRSDAGRTLLALSRALSNVRDVDAAIDWQCKLNAWWQAYGHLTKEKTFNDGQWWFTHDRLRKAWKLLAKLTRDGTLFTFVTHGNTRITSPLEGGINNGIRHVLRHHRGMSEEHMKRAAEWFLTLHEIPISQAHQFIPNPSLPSTPTTEDDETDQEPAEPNYYDTGLSAEEGLWARKGWGGRTS